MEHCGIVVENPSSLCGRMLLSGVMSIPELPDTSQTRAYHADALLPDTNFRALRLPECRSLAATGSTPDGGTIEVVHFSEALRGYLNNNPDKLPAAISKPHELTTTWDSTLSLKAGLHVDSTDHRPLQTRIESRRRIGLNTGPGHRFLLIGTIDMGTISTALGYTTSHKPITSDIHRYHQHAIAGEVPPLQCLWLRIKPGEAYIVPTEMLIHDGSTIGQKESSSIGFWLGDLKPGTFGSALA